MNEPSTSLWKKLNEVSDRLQKVSEQLIEANAINKWYHHALDQQRAKVEIIEQDNHKAQGVISMLRCGLGFISSIKFINNALS